MVGLNTENLTTARENPDIVNKRLTPNVLKPSINVIKTAKVDTYVVKENVCNTYCVNKYNNQIHAYPVNSQKKRTI